MMRLIAAIGAIVTALLFETSSEGGAAGDGDDRKAEEDRIFQRFEETIDARINNAFERWLEKPGSDKPTDPPAPKAGDKPTGDPPAPTDTPKVRPKMMDVLFGSKS